MLVMVWIWFSSSFLASNSSFWKPWVPWRQAEMSSLMRKACSRRNVMVRSWLFSLSSSWLLCVFGITGRKEWPLVRKRKQHQWYYKNELEGPEAELASSLLLQSCLPCGEVWNFGRTLSICLVRSWFPSHLRRSNFGLGHTLWMFHVP